MADAKDTRYVTDLVRSADRPRYYATLFAPQGARDDLFALYGFAAEIGRIPNQVREPRLGEIRLQWWHDALQAAVSSGEEGPAPALRTLLAAIRRWSLPHQPLLAMIEARVADLYADPPATITDLEGYFGETESAQFQLASLVLGGTGPETADIAGHAGIAYGLARRLAGFTRDRARGRTLIPAEILASGGLFPAATSGAGPEREIPPALARMHDLAQGHLRRVRHGFRQLEASVLPAFLPLATTPALLARVETRGSSLAESSVDVSDLESLLRVGWARMRGLN